MRNEFRSVSVPADSRGVGQLMALAARPPSARTPDRMNGGIKVIQQHAAQAFYDLNGFDYPDKPRDRARSRAQREESSALLYFDFRKGVEAGRAFHRSLRLKAQGKTRSLPPFVVRDGDASFELSIPAISHNDWIETKYNEQLSSETGSDLKNVRKSLWDNWLPTIHVSAAFALVIDMNIKRQGEFNWLTFCDSLIADRNGHLAAWLVHWSGEFERFAEQVHFWTRNRPIHIELERSFAVLG